MKAEISSMQTPGARWTSHEVRFALRSEEAAEVELSLFETSEPHSDAKTVALTRGSGDLWEAVIPDLQPGQLYGYRVHGPWDPSRGLRFNPAKLLLDPMSAAISGVLTWHPNLSGSVHQDGFEMPHPGDSAPYVPRSVVIEPSFDWQGDQPLATPWSHTVIYECHVRGMTRLHPHVPSDLRGRYLGLCQDAVVEHLLALGVTAIELLPVQHHVSEAHLQQLGLTNYFGYNPIGWMAPHGPYASADRGEQVREFKTMVRGLHAAGLEVLLDVVFNHTAEGNERGATLSHRGIDNRHFYRLSQADARHYENYSGCGNTVNFGHQRVIDQVLATLRYWVDEMHVDGFRFDLAPVVGRESNRFDTDAAFFHTLQTDPVLSRVKLIAEPWDLGPQGYSLGRFPRPWREWNDRYRDAIRSYWRGDRVPTSEIIQRLEGSGDILQRPADNASASLNFITSHDGFTLRDLVSYEKKHNWDNGEQNRDGHAHNLSRNWGVEGPTESPGIQALRARARRNFIATLAFSCGTPMLSHGDEIGRTQAGNNNAYCQDNPVTWMDWQSAPEQHELLGFCQRVMALRRELELGTTAQGSWLSASAGELHLFDVESFQRLPFGWIRSHHGGMSLTVFNADDRGHLFELPDTGSDEPWKLEINTARPGQRVLPGRAVRVPSRAVLLLTQKR